jgi:hypothetical protein
LLNGWLMRPGDIPQSVSWDSAAGVGSVLLRDGSVVLLVAGQPNSSSRRSRSGSSGSSGSLSCATASGSVGYTASERILPVLSNSSSKARERAAKLFGFSAPQTGTCIILLLFS